MSDLETAHRVALARELTASAGFPLRDRYGFAARDADVAAVMAILTREPSDYAAGQAIGLANATGDLELADGHDTPIDEDYERGIVAALRPLMEQRWDAAARSLP